jgi:hypothetical protein
VLILSLQMAFNARRYLYGQDPIEWITSGQAEQPSVTPSQPPSDDERSKWLHLNGVAVFSYDIGTVLLGLSVAAALVPHAHDAQVMWRWAGVAIALSGAVGEVWWSHRLIFHRDTGTPTPVSIIEKQGESGNV